MAFTFARCCHPAIRRAGGKKKKKDEEWAHTRVQGWPHLSGSKTLLFFHGGKLPSRSFFFFFLKCTSVEEGGEGGWSEDETIDLIMHACFLIHCSGGKGRGRG